MNNYSKFLGIKNAYVDEPVIGSPASIKISETDVEQYFDINPTIIGQGQFGIIRVARQTNSLSHTFALKTMQKKKISPVLKSLYKEVILLSSCDHPNIVRFYELFECEEMIHFQLEYCHGKNLGNMLRTIHRLAEPRLKVIFRQVLLAINHMHLRGICHRDIKPENFMFKYQDDDHSLKLLDFGFAKRFFGNGKCRMYSLVGTPAFVAPEVLSGDYDEKCDIWSAGILLYQMGCGNLPYDFVGDLQSLHKQIIQPDIDYKRNFAGIRLSKHFFGLLKGLLRANEKKRISVSQALTHKWFDANLPMEIDQSQKNQLVKNFFEFKKYTSFQKNVFKIYVKLLSKFEIRIYQNLFLKIDRDLDGIISFPELKYFLVQNDLFTSNEECISHIKSLHSTDKHHIFYTEFLAATIEKSFILSDWNLKKLFDMLKLKNQELLSMSSIRNIYILAGYMFNEQAFDDLLKKSGISIKSNDGINFEEFQVLMTNTLESITLNNKEFDKVLQEEITSKNVMNF